MSSISSYLACCISSAISESLGSDEKGSEHSIFSSNISEQEQANQYGDSTVIRHQKDLISSEEFLKNVPFSPKPDSHTQRTNAVQISYEVNQISKASQQEESSVSKSEDMILENRENSSNDGNDMNGDDDVAKKNNDHAIGRQMNTQLRMSQDELTLASPAYETPEQGGCKTDSIPAKGINKSRSFKPPKLARKLLSFLQGDGKK